MSNSRMEMNFCRRCGTKLVHKAGALYVCEQQHRMYANASPTMTVVLRNAKQEVLVATRGIEPGKGMLDLPGGFCDSGETFEQTTYRELLEELGLAPDDYSPLRFLQSLVDDYEFGGEMIPVTVVVFEVVVKPGKTPAAKDDIAQLSWMALDNINLEKVYFPCIRDLIAELREKTA